MVGTVRFASDELAIDLNSKRNHIEFKKLF